MQLLALSCSLLSWFSTATAATWDEVRAALAEQRPTADAVATLVAAEDQTTRDGVLTRSSVERRAWYLALEASTSRAVSAHLDHAPTDRALATVALQTVLRRKGRLVDTAHDTIGVVRRAAGPGGRALIEDLVRATRQLDTVPPSSHDDARARVDELQAKLAELSQPYRTVAGLGSTAQIAVTLGRRTLLVEFVTYRPWDLEHDAFGEPHYGVYTLDHAGTVLAASLGPAEPIDDAVRALRDGIVARRDVGPLADDLRARLFGDLPWVGRNPRLVVAPDGLLGFVPFELVLAEAVDGEYHVPRVTYLTSGSERPLTVGRSPETSEPVVVFDVAYGPPDLPWRRLRETENEADVVAGHVDAVRTLSGTAATPREVAAISRPLFLHLASHAFFDSGTDPRRFAPFDEDPRGLLVSRPVSSELLDLVNAEHPGLVSGVVLAGANARGGVLTAAEWSRLDLWGTRFVALTASAPTGGTLRNAQGIQGLRRALFLTGAQAQVLSLWKTDDGAATALARKFYERLASGAPVEDALHAAKQHLARSPGTRHPYYWAAFVVSGRTRAHLR